MDSSTIAHGPVGTGGMPRLRDALLNKGTAFTDEEREWFGLEGLLPARVESLQEHATKVFENLRAKSSAMDRYLYLRCVQDENETLFYRVVLDHLEETLPII